MLLMTLILAVVLIVLLTVIVVDLTTGLIVGGILLPLLLMAMFVLRKRGPATRRAAPRDTVGYRHRAIAQFERGDLNGALQDYDHTLNAEISGTMLRGAVDKFRAVLFTERGQVYFAQKQYQKALEDFQSAYELHHNFHPALAWLAITHYRLRNLEEARIWWQAALEKNPEYAALNGLNWVKKQMGWLAPPIVEAQATAALLNARP